MQLVTIENRSTLVTDAGLSEIVVAMNLQLSRDFNKSGWVKRGLAPAAQCQALPKGAKVPAGAWNVILLDHSNQAGALGWHDDEGSTPIPYAEVFVADARQDGLDECSVVSHEVLEMLCDPFVDPMPPKTVLRPGTTDRYIVEVGDPVQGNDYDAGNGRKVADFAYPSWWGLSPFRPCSFRGAATQPFEVCPQGYMSIQKADGKWTQVFGQERSSHPAWASRLPRIHPIVRP